MCIIQNNLTDLRNHVNNKISHACKSIGGGKGGAMGLQPHLILECSIGFFAIEILFGQQISPT